MNSSKFRFTLDLQRTQSQISIPVTRGDTARTWIISFSDGSLPYELADGCLAKLEVKRPTGTHLEAFCAIENGTTVKYEFSQNENTAAVEGIHDCAVVIFDEEGNKVAAPRFTMIVSDRVINYDDIEISDEDKTLVEAMVVAEAGRQSAENARSNAETARAAAEAGRQSAENARSNAETARAKSERDRTTAESSRTVAESSRERNFQALQKEMCDIADGMVSTSVTVTPIEGGHKITFTDKDGDRDFFLMDGKDGKPGTQGPQGIQGPQGVQGLQGIQGEPGKPFSIEKTYTSVAAMNSGFDRDGVTEGGFVVITSGVENEDNAKLFLKGKSGYIFITDLSGAQGMQGPQGIQGLQGVPGKNGENGQRGTGILFCGDTPHTYSPSTSVGGGKAKYRFSLSAIRNSSGKEEILVGDLVSCGQYLYHVYYMDSSYAYIDERTHIGGTDGENGKSAYEYALDGGYEGSEADFVKKMAKELPTKLSDFTNDSNFITASGAPVQSVNGKTGALTFYYYDVGADCFGTAETKVSAHNTNTSAHNDIRLLIEGLTSRLNALANSDDTTLDQMKEIVDYIKANKSLIDDITTSKVNVSDIVNDINTSSPKRPLSAEQGVKLKEMIEKIAIPTKVSQLQNDSGYVQNTQYVTMTAVDKDGVSHFYRIFGTEVDENEPS